MPNKAATLPKNGDSPSRAHGGNRAAKSAQQPAALSGADSFPSQLDFQLVFASHPEAMVVLDLHRRIRMCNPAFENLFQHREAEILGAELDVLLACDEHQAEALQFSERAAAGEVLRANTRRRRRDGSFVDVQITCVPLRQDGKIVGCYGIYQDITERCEAERAQQEAEKKLSLLFENAVEGIFQTTVDGQLLSVNPALARMCGYGSAAEMLATVHDIGKDFYADPQTRGEFQRAMEQNGAVEAFEYQLRRKNGALIWISENARVIRDADGNVTAYEGTMEDITERKRSELERQITFEIIHGVNVTDNLDELLYLIHQSLNKVLYAENCFVALYESASGMFHFPFFVDQFDEAPPPQQVGRSCTAYVYRTGRAMLIPQQIFDRLAAEGEVELVGTPSPSWLGVPLRTPAATIGVLVVQHYENVAAYTERDLEFLASVGGQIALAIDRKRAEEKIRESEARLRVLVEQLPAVL
jgi:PAS domain S-box-containing protein